MDKRHIGFARLRAAACLCLAIVGFDAASIAAAQSPAIAPQTGATPLDEAVRQQLGRRQRLGVSRGLSPAAIPDIDADDLIQALSNPDYPPGTALLLYSVTNGKLTAWLLGSQGPIASATSDGQAADIVPAIDLLMDTLDVGRARGRAARLRSEPALAPDAADENEVVADPKPALRSLSTLLLPPGLRHGLAMVDHLIVIPWGPIGTIPFAALMPFEDGSQTIDHFSITIAPSIEEFVHKRAAGKWNAAQAFGHPLIIGNPTIASEGAWIVPPLPGAETEARQVAGMLRARATTGKAATKKFVTGEAPASTLIYLATHGVANTRDPLDKGFVMLAGSPSAGGNWTAREVQAADLHKTELVILSACQTGLGGAHEGGTIGLARAFQLAGAKRVAMSLWSIDDLATMSLMTSFTGNLRRSSPSEALRRAMIATRAKFPDPALWASFLIFSDGR